MIGGQWQQAYGTTCQQSDGTWRMTDQAAPLHGATVTPTPVPTVAYAHPARYPEPIYYIPVGPATSDGPDVHSK
jgi:hypothetical protein